MHEPLAGKSAGKEKNLIGKSHNSKYGRARFKIYKHALDVV